MRKRRGWVGSLIGLLMPLILILGGAGLASLGVSQGSLVLMVMGAVIVLAGVLWGVIMMDLANPFDLL